MDIQKVNTVLNRAIRIFEHAELESSAAMIESYVGYGGTEAPDHSPAGDPFEGGDGGVDNMETEQDAFYSYLMYVAQSVSEQAKCSEDKAVSCMETLADDMAATGEMPSMPDSESGTAEEFSAWVGAAKTCGFARRAAEFAAMQTGQDLGAAADAV